MTTKVVYQSGAEVVLNGTQQAPARHTIEGRFQAEDSGEFGIVYNTSSYDHEFVRERQLFNPSWLKAMPTVKEISYTRPEQLS